MNSKIAYLALIAVAGQANCMDPYKDETPEQRNERLLPLQIERQKREKEFDEWYALQVKKLVEEAQIEKNNQERMRKHLEHMDFIKKKSTEEQMQIFKELGTLLSGVNANGQRDMYKTLKERLELKPLKFSPLGETQTIDIPYIRQCVSDWRILYPKCSDILSSQKYGTKPKK